jgi:hypothetical protein
MQYRKLRSSRAGDITITHLPLIYVVVVEQSGRETVNGVLAQCCSNKYDRRVCRDNVYALAGEHCVYSERQSIIVAIPIRYRLSIDADPEVILQNSYRDSVGSESLVYSAVLADTVSQFPMMRVRDRYA